MFIRKISWKIFLNFHFHKGNTSSNGEVSIVKLVFGGGKGAKASLPTPPSFGFRVLQGLH